ncbi:MAG TPA: N-acetylmuramoyl-L-alanine amidase [bacterium]|nr:N-acetylmuramoyl-L-alanine amidase [bacterium]HPS28897.1 N-acetylmuramoyl-L-alanine amidase [bacterium]
MKKVLFLLLTLYLFTITAEDSIKEEDRESLSELITDLTSKEPAKKLNDIKVWPGETSIRVAIYPNEKVKYKYNLLKGEKDDRIYIDLISVDGDGFSLPDVKYDSFLKGIRLGKKDNGLRIVLDTGKVESYNVMEMEEPWRIVIDYYGKKPVEPVRTVETVEKNKLTKQGPEKKKTVVVIDPGHGGKDPGAVVKGLYEKDIVLKLAQKIKKMSSKYDDIEVKLTRDTDIFLPLEERAAIANTMNGGLFISIHANAFSNKNIGGVEVYHLDNTRDNYTDKLAMVENKISDTNSLLNTILVDMTMSYYIKDSLNYATTLGISLKDNLKPYDVKVRGFKKGALFYVLVGARMPSLLLEIGYLTNVKEKSLLKKDSYIEMLAKTVLDSVHKTLRSGAVSEEK